MRNTPRPVCSCDLRALDFPGSGAPLIFHVCSGNYRRKNSASDNFPCRIVCPSQRRTGREPTRRAGLTHPFMSHQHILLCSRRSTQGSTQPTGICSRFTQSRAIFPRRRSCWIQKFFSQAHGTFGIAQVKSFFRSRSYAWLNGKPRVWSRSSCGYHGDIFRANFGWNPMVRWGQYTWSLAHVAAPLRRRWLRRAASKG